ncbi:unnamed protein product [Meloidogyne enterolobii]|uniref:Uncharacterized protein n=1 Tax=Meloidogyne enterolobii TaxID=390850 RepID=A0ACB0XUF8_MELEN
MAKFLLCLLQFCILIIYGSSQLNNNPNQITGLPGLSAKLNFKHYSGSLFNLSFLLILF